MPLCALKIRQKEQREKGWERNIWDSEVKVGYLPKLLFTLSLRQHLSLILDLTDSVGLTGQQARQCSCLCLPNFGIVRNLILHLGTEDLMSGPHTCRTLYWRIVLQFELFFHREEIQNEKTQGVKWRGKDDGLACQLLHPGVTPCVAIWGPTYRDLICLSSILLLSGDK